MSLYQDFITSRQSYILDKMFDYISELEIYQGLIQRPFKLRNPISSPLRVDHKASFSIFAAKEGHLVFRDITHGISGNVITFIKAYAYLVEGHTLTTAKEIVQYVDQKFGLGMLDTQDGFVPVATPKPRVTYVYQEAHIYYKKRAYTPYDIRYWVTQLGVNLTLLEEYNIHSIKYILNEVGHIIYRVKSYQLYYAYQIYDAVKTYQPQAEPDYKFRNTCPDDDYRYYQGFQQLRHTDPNITTIVITKSMKDVVVYRAHTDNVDVIAPNSETTNVSEDFVKFCRQYYKNIVIIYDYDREGVRRANKLRKLYLQYYAKEQVKVIFTDTKRVKINGKLRVMYKDGADYRYHLGATAFQAWLTKHNLYQQPIHVNLIL
jgi:5S rRNA maturation endonuclease (ribonuclease M5)